MKPMWVDLSEKDRAAYRTVITFLNNRMQERATIEWALKLKSNITVKRLALLDLFEQSSNQKMKEPWNTAWKLIEESWNYSDKRETSRDRFQIQKRLNAGDRSGAVIKMIVEMVEPRLKVEPFSTLHLSYQTPPEKPKKIEDLFSISLTSGDVVDPMALSIEKLKESRFLIDLINELEAVVLKGITIARRIGWDGKSQLWRLRAPQRVNYVSAAERLDDNHEPDEFRHGLAPSVKLLHAAVSQLKVIDFETAKTTVDRWKLMSNPIHLRLWASLSADDLLASANEVSAMLLSLDNQQFWNLDHYPEIAELRSLRFSAFDIESQKKIIKKIRKMPPKSHWSKRTDLDEVNQARLYWAVRELKRIEIAGNSLPIKDTTWMESMFIQFPNLVDMNRVDAGFKSQPKARWVSSNPDDRYNSLTGKERLRSLESALISAERGWDDDPAGRAIDWIREPKNTLEVLKDLECSPKRDINFPNVWERFGWAHSTTEQPVQDAKAMPRDLEVEASSVLALLYKLPEETIQGSIEGISHWLTHWIKLLKSSPKLPKIWQKYWPIAVSATNAEPSEDDIQNITLDAWNIDDEEAKDLDTLNSASGRLVGIFLALCPNLTETPAPFKTDKTLLKIRNTVVGSPGRSGLIAKHRLIQRLPYFLRADKEWTAKYLIEPLSTNTTEASALWQAIATQIHFTKVLKVIGTQMAERATDTRLSRETRRSLVFSIVVECLYSYLQDRVPAIPYPRVQQMLRSLEDEVRAKAAEAIQKFIQDVSVSSIGTEAESSVEVLFRTAASPFLQYVWPQEQSLSTEGVSRALVDIPASSGNAFVEAVDLIERFLIPFECWSLFDYGLRGNDEGNPKLTQIDTPEKAEAFLRLLNKTIGSSDGAVVPHDLPDALEQIAKVAPKLNKNPMLRRLETAARR